KCATDLRSVPTGRSGLMSVSNHYLLLAGAQIENQQRQLLRLQEGADYVTLYRKTAYADLADCGPVLIKTTPDSPLLRHFQAHWQSTAGLQVFSDADPAELQTHLRSLVHARVPGGSTVLFRYHDPRILPLWLETLSAEEQIGRASCRERVTERGGAV